MARADPIRVWEASPNVTRDGSYISFDSTAMPQTGSELNSGFKSPAQTRSSSSPSPAHDPFMHQNRRWNCSPCTASVPPIISSQRLHAATSIRCPRSMAASETPFTVQEAVRNINHYLLKSCVLRAQEMPEEALEQADYCLYLAEVRKLYYLQSKSQFHRGLCLMDVGRYEEANKAFTRAASVKWWAWRVAELKAEAVRMITQTKRELDFAERKGP